MTTHRLKTWPGEWNAIKNGTKRFELRRADRDFCVGDILELAEWDPGKGKTVPGLGYSGRVLVATVTYILHGGRFGLSEYLCIMSIDNIIERFRTGDGSLVNV